jgi:hypothetical protein
LKKKKAFNESGLKFTLPSTGVKNPILIKGNIKVQQVIEDKVSELFFKTPRDNTKNVKYEFELNGEKFLLYNIHASFGVFTDPRKWTDLANEVKKLAIKHVVIMGDFNIDYEKNPFLYPTEELNREFNYITMKTPELNFELDVSEPTNDYLLLSRYFILDDEYDRYMENFSDIETGFEFNNNVLLLRV